VRLAVDYSPAPHSPLRPESDAPPDLCTVLAQGPGKLLASASPASELVPPKLAFGRDLVLQSVGLSVLLVTPEA
jgi:hypothetical protein